MLVQYGVCFSDLLSVTIKFCYPDDVSQEKVMWGKNFLLLSQVLLKNSLGLARSCLLPSQEQ